MMLTRERTLPIYTEIQRWGCMEGSVPTLYDLFDYTHCYRKWMIDHTPMTKTWMMKMMIKMSKWIMVKELAARKHQHQRQKVMTKATLRRILHSPEVVGTKKRTRKKRILFKLVT